MEIEFEEESVPKEKMASDPANGSEGFVVEDQALN